MKTDRNLFLKTVFSAAVLALAPFFCAAAAVESEYWRGAEELREGVKVKELSFTEPRLMKAWMMRIDLRTPGIGFTTTERDARWGEPMPDYTNGVRLIRTKRDRGVVVVTDPRLVTKNYGAVFRKSIPASVHTVASQDELLSRTSDFFCL